MIPMRTAVFEDFIAPARRRPQLWRLLAGLALIGAVYAAWIGGMALALGLAARRMDEVPRLDAQAITANPYAVLLLLFSFAGLLVGVALAVRLLHRRPVATLVGPWRVALRDFAFGAGVVAVIGAAGLLLWQGRSDLVPGVAPELWLLLLPLALLGVLIQTGAEEAIFRGYLQQQLAARFRSALIWMVLPSLAFGMLHFSPAQMGGNAWLIVVATALFGLVAADLTARSGTLGLAWGLHFANNLLALLVVSAGTGLEGLALYRLPEGADTAARMRPLILFDMGLMAVLWGVCRLWLRGR